MSRSTLSGAYKIADTCFDSQGRIDKSKLEMVLKQIGILPRAKGLVFLKSFYKAVRSRIESRSVHVVSAVELNSEQRDKILETFPSNDYDFKVDSNLLGGLRVRIGDTILDTSIERKLMELTR